MHFQVEQIGGKTEIASNVEEKLKLRPSVLHQNIIIYYWMLPFTCSLALTLKYKELLECELYEKTELFKKA